MFFFMFFFFFFEFPPSSPITRPRQQLASKGSALEVACERDYWAVLAVPLVSALP